MYEFFLIGLLNLEGKFVGILKRFVYTYIAHWGLDKGMDMAI